MEGKKEERTRCSDFAYTAGKPGLRAAVFLKWYYSLWSSLACGLTTEYPSNVLSLPLLLYLSGLSAQWLNSAYSPSCSLENRHLPCAYLIFCPEAV